MKKILTKIKRHAGIVLFGALGAWMVADPTAFITLGGDIGYKMISAIWLLILGFLAISQADRHWSHPCNKKCVSLSKFMNEANSNQKTVIYATLILSVAIILAAVATG